MPVVVKLKYLTRRFVMKVALKKVINDSTREDMDALFFYDRIEEICDHKEGARFSVQVNYSEIEGSLEQLKDDISELAKPLTIDNKVEARQIELACRENDRGTCSVLQTYLKSVCFSFSDNKDEMNITLECQK